MWLRPLLRRTFTLSSPVNRLTVYRKGQSPVPAMPAKHKFSRDKIFIEGLLFKCLCGPDAFGRSKPQPVDLSVTLGTTIARAAVEDRVDLSIDYSDLVKRLGKLEE